MNKRFNLLTLTLMMAIAIFANTAVSKEFSDISAAELHKKMKADSKVYILDVRTSREYNAVDIKGATLIPVQHLDTRYNEINDKKNVTIYVICRSGTRSKAASGILVSKGFKKVYNVEGGMSDWISQGFPVEK